MMWHENLPNARWFFVAFAACADMIEIEIRKRECSDKHVVCHATCCRGNLNHSKVHHNETRLALL